MEDESAPDPLPMYVCEGEVYVNIGGTMFKLIPTDEAMAVMEARHGKKDPPKRQAVATPAAPAPEAPDPKALAARRRAAEAMEELDEARERFASQGNLREQFDVPSGTRPGHPQYDAGLERYLDRLAKNP